MTAVGITVISRGDDGAGDDVTVTLFYNDDTSEVVETDFFIDDTTGGDDTFFGYQAPSGRLITGIYLDIDVGEASSIGDPEFTTLDDLAFIAIPEPATLALLALGGLALFRRPRRR